LFKLLPNDGDFLNHSLHGSGRLCHFFQFRARTFTYYRPTDRHGSFSTYRVVCLFSLSFTAGLDREGVARACARANEDDCNSVSGKTVNIGGVSYSYASAEYCTCTSDLCNSAPQTSVGRLTIGFTVASLLALAAARFLSG